MPHNNAKRERGVFTEYNKIVPKGGFTHSYYLTLNKTINAQFFLDNFKGTEKLLKHFIGLTIVTILADSCDYFSLFIQ